MKLIDHNKLHTTIQFSNREALLLGKLAKLAATIMRPGLRRDIKLFATALKKLLPFDVE